MNPQPGLDEEVTVQDAAREAALAALLGLSLSGRRMGVDAFDPSGNPFELKSTTTSGFGTGHHFGPRALAAWRSRYVVAAFGRNLRSGFDPEQIYALHPDDLAAWAKPYEERFAAHLEATERLRELVLASGGGEPEMAHLDHLSERALPINNPKVSLAYCRARGTLLETPFAASLEAFVRDRPLAA